MAKSPVIVNVIDTNTNEYTIKNVTLKTVAKTYNTSVNTVKNAFYKQLLIKKRYKLEFLYGGVVEGGEVTTCHQNKEMDYLIKFRPMWDKARFAINPNAQKGAKP